MFKHIKKWDNALFRLIIKTKLKVYKNNEHILRLFRCNFNEIFSSKKSFAIKIIDYIG